MCNYKCRTTTFLSQCEYDTANVPSTSHITVNEMPQWLMPCGRKTHEATNPFFRRLLHLAQAKNTRREFFPLLRTSNWLNRQEGSPSIHRFRTETPKAMDIAAVAMGNALLNLETATAASLAMKFCRRALHTMASTPPSSAPTITCAGVCRLARTRR